MMGHRVMRALALLSAAILALGIAWPGHAAPPAPSFTIVDATADEAAGQLCFQVKKHGKLNSSPSTVRFYTLDVTAKTPGDYAAQSVTLAFTAAQTLSKACVPLVNDGVPEPTETLTGRLQALTNARLYDGTAIGTITDSDVATPVPPPPPPAPRVVTCQDITVRENVGNALVTCSISGSNGLATTVDWRVVGDTSSSMATATMGLDYVGSSGRLVIPADGAGFSFQVPIINDSAVEQTETTGGTLTCVANCTVGHNPVIAIEDDDTPAQPPTAGLLRIKACRAPTTSGTEPEGGAQASVGQLVKKIEAGSWGWTSLVHGQILASGGMSIWTVQPVDSSGNPTTGLPFSVFEDCLEAAQ